MQLTSNSDKITRDYFDSLLIETRYLDAVLPTTEMTLFGETFRTPIMTAALSHLHNTAREPSHAHDHRAPDYRRGICGKCAVRTGAAGRINFSSRSGMK